MTIFDLIFILVFLITLATIIRIAYLLIRQRWQQALRITKMLGALLGLYFATVIVVSIASPQRVIPMHQDRCFDDWCVAVEHVDVVSSIASVPTASRAQGAFYVVNLRVSSRARRVSQRAPDGVVYILDDLGRRFDVSEAGQRAYEAVNGATSPIDTLMSPSSSFTTVCVFDVQTESKNLGLVVQHVIRPGWFIIGDSASIFHKRTVMRLEAGG